MNTDTWIAIDGGTTNTRGSLVINNQVIDTVTFSVGVRNSSGNNLSPVRSAVSECLKEICKRHSLQPNTVKVVASGMLGSEAGLVNVPHVMTPASPEDAASRSVIWFDEQVWPEPIRIIPGVRTGPGLEHASAFENQLSQDIMRGEETQTWGLWRHFLDTQNPHANQPWLLLWPGSHTKLIAIDRAGIIQGSFTTLAGELFSALRSATLLQRSMPDHPPQELSSELIDLAAKTVSDYGLLRAAFWTRVADITGTLDASQRFSWLSASVIAADVEAICHHPWLKSNSFVSLRIGGDLQRQAVYAHLLKRSQDIHLDLLKPVLCSQAAAKGAVYLAKLTDHSK